MNPVSELPSSAFAIRANGQWLPSGAWHVDGSGSEDFPDGSTVERTAFTHEAAGLRAVATCTLFPGLDLAAYGVEIENTGTAACVLDRVDTVSIALPDRRYRVLWYSGAWGQEFTPHSAPLREPLRLETRSGRASHGVHPWFALVREDGTLLCGAIAWSGNHVSRFEPSPDGWTLYAGLNDWEFSTTISPGGTFTAPSVLLAAASDRDGAANAFHAWCRRFGVPENALAKSLPVEWNHWWPYNDKGVNEEVIRENARVAAKMGVQVATLDAGWFGPPDETNWEDYRGDWHIRNTRRFPNGIRPLSDDAHARDLKFGLWCEIEAAGPKASLNAERPDLLATRDGKPLGQVCFGNPETRRWAIETLDALLTETGADWVKVDYNVDCGAGCNRTDHGHGAGDGLYRHVLGLHEVLDALRAKHPDVLIEGCSSGGLRIDLGLLQHLNAVFLSDPDYPVHNLQLFWGALDYVAPDACLHWMWSQCTGEFPSFDPHAPDLTPERLDYYVRSGMLGMFGMSQKLPELPEWVRERIAHHVRVYRERVAPFVREADVYRLTGQPLRDGGGDRWCAFQYAMPDRANSALFAFRLPGGEETRTLYPRGLDPDRAYRLEWDGTDRTAERSGASLIEDGLQMDGLSEEASALIFLTG